MKALRRLFLALPWLLFLPSGYGETEEQEGLTAPADVSEEVPVSPEALDLLTRSLTTVVAESSFQELKIWSRQLGLSDRGGRDTLADGLYEHYGIDPLLAEKAAKKRSSKVIAGEQLKIQSAEILEYLPQNKKKGDNIVRVSGNVVASLVSEGQSYEIRADQVVINESKGILTALGDVHYSQMGGGEGLGSLGGDLLVIKFPETQGALFGASSEVEEGKITYHISLDRVRFLGPDATILDKAVVATDEGEEPLFSIRGKRFWLLGPGEVGLLGGTIYVGEVPVFYFPFFYQPGGRALFNPAYGYRDREGFFVQTTTYLLGEQKKKSNEGSIFKFFDSFEENKEKERLGLYLLPKRSSVQPSGHSVRLLVDLYSRLGSFVGFEGVYKPADRPLLGPSSLTFEGGVGVSRSIDSKNRVYFPENKFRGEWNGTILGSTVLPFRVGAKVEFEYPLLTGFFSYYSDPFFRRDFLVDRDERFRWTNFTLTAFKKKRINFATVTPQWYLKGTWDMRALENFLPFVSSASLRYQAQVDFLRRRDSLIAARHPFSPARQFFHFDEILFPYLNLSVGGTLFKYPRSRGKSPSSEEKSTKVTDLLPPWEEKIQKDQSPPPKDSVEFYGPLAPLSAQRLPPWFQFDLSYDNRTSGFLKWEADSRNWTTRRKVTNQFLPAASTLTEDAEVTYTTQALRQILKLSGKNEVKLLKKGHLEEKKDRKKGELTYEERDRFDSYLNLLGDWSATLYPLKEFHPYWAATQLSYRIGAKLYEDFYEKKASSTKRGADAYQRQQRVASWNEESIRFHSAEGVLAFTPTHWDLRSSFFYTFPPLKRLTKVEPSLSYKRGGWESRIYFSFIDAELSEKKLDQDGEAQPEYWQTQQLTFSNSYRYEGKILKVDPRLTASTRLEYDIRRQLFTLYEIKTSFFGLYANYEMAYQARQRWDSLRRVLVFEEKAFLSKDLVVGYQWPWKIGPHWKRRLTQELSLDLSLRMNLQHYYGSTLRFKIGHKLALFEIFDFNISITSSNKSMHLYFPTTRRFLGIRKSHSFLGDLWKSFNFFDIKDRIDSPFNMESLDVDFTWHMSSWDLIFSYSGGPKRKKNRYVWDTSFSIFVRLNPIPLFQSKVIYKDEKLRTERT